jgi:hypothetical protein
MYDQLADALRAGDLEIMFSRLDGILCSWNKNINVLHSDSCTYRTIPHHSTTHTIRVHQHVRERPTAHIIVFFHFFCFASDCGTHPRVVCGICGRPRNLHQHASESEYHSKYYAARCSTHPCMCMRNVTFVCASCV